VKKKKSKEIQIVNGRPIWPPMKNQIKGAIRRIFRLSPWMKLSLQKARVEKPKVLKDGSVSKKPDVYYRCAMCLGEFKQKDVQVDHIVPVVPIERTLQEMSYDEIVDRIFCGLDNLQVLCKSCHDIKTKNEKKNKVGKS
jgi:5-methylcytosine-specific restriction endonuclease McrA